MPTFGIFFFRISLQLDHSVLGQQLHIGLDGFRHIDHGVLKFLAINSEIALQRHIDLGIVIHIKGILVQIDIAGDHAVAQSGSATGTVDIQRGADIANHRKLRYRKLIQQLFGVGLADRKGRTNNIIRNTVSIHQAFIGRLRHTTL